MGGHEILSLHRPERDSILVSAPIAHHAHRLHRQEYGECLRRFFVPPGGAQLVDENRVGSPQQIGELAVHFPENANTQTRSGERVTEHHVMRQP